MYIVQLAVTEQGVLTQAYMKLTVVFIVLHD